MLKRILYVLVLVSIAFASESPFTYVHPQPGSQYHNPQTTIILKMAPDHVKMMEPQYFIVNGSVSGQCSGELVKSANTVIFKPNELFQIGESVTVNINYPVTYEFAFTIRKNEQRQIQQEILSKPVAETSINSTMGVEPVRLINGVAVPSDFPDINTTVHGETAPGYMCFASTFPRSSNLVNYVLMIENDGTPFFYRKYEMYPGSSLGSADFHKHKNGLLSFYHYIQSEDGFHVVLDEHFVEIDTFRAAHGYRTDNHEMILLDNGHALLIAEDDVRVDMSELVSGGNPNCWVQGNYIQEVDNEGNVFWEWRCWDHLEITEVDQINLRGGYIDYVHLNSVTPDYDGNYVASFRNLSQVAKINSNTGDLMWRLWGQKNEFDINDETPIGHQHCIKPVPEKPNHYTIFDNGNTRSPNRSRGVEYKIDTETMIADKMWEFYYNNIQTGYMGSVQAFTNGNYYIDWSAGGSRAIACEVDADNNLLVEVNIDGISTYRSRRYEFDGMMDYPFLTTENLNLVVRLIFNKFGDKNVDHYNIYFGKTENDLSLLSSTSETYFDVDAFSLDSNSTYYFGVTAVDGSGTESAMSSVQSAYVNPIASSQNVVQNGEFASEDNWEFGTWDANASGGLDGDGQYQISITSGGNDDSDIYLIQEGLPVLRGYEYVFEFDAYCTKTRQIRAMVRSGDSRKTNYGRIGYTTLTRRREHFKYTFTMENPTDYNAHVIFQCGNDTGDIFIDNVKLYFVDLESELEPLQTPWENSDIGEVAVRGFAGRADDTVFIKASGSDIWGSSDEFHYVYQPFNGDGEISARVSSITNTNGWAKAGVMIRESTDANSKHAMMVVTPENGMSFQRRPETGQDSYHTPGTNVKAPYWVRLVRKNNTFTGYESEDGQNWTEVASENISMKNNVYVGLAVTSHNDGEECDAIFETVLINGQDTLVDGDHTKTIKSLVLHQAYPNPFNAQTNIQFELPEQEHVKLTVFDIQGRKVTSLVNKECKAGVHRVNFDAKNLATGLYFYKLETKHDVVMKKMILVR